MKSRLFLGILFPAILFLGACTTDVDTDDEEIVNEVSGEEVGEITLSNPDSYIGLLVENGLGTNIPGPGVGSARDAAVIDGSDIETVFFGSSMCPTDPSLKTVVFDEDGTKVEEIVLEEKVYSHACTKDYSPSHYRIDFYEEEEISPEVKIILITPLGEQREQEIPLVGRGMGKDTD